MYYTCTCQLYNTHNNEDQPIHPVTQAEVQHATIIFDSSTI